MRGLVTEIFLHGIKFIFHYTFVSPSYLLNYQFYSSSIHKFLYTHLLYSPPKYQGTKNKNTNNELTMKKRRRFEDGYTRNG